MARKCSICNRGPKKSIKRSHSNIASKRILAVNIQKKLINGKRVRICSKCLRTRTKK